MEHNTAVDDLELEESDLVRKWAGRIQQLATKQKRGFSWIEVDDLEQEGELGLLRARASYKAYKDKQEEKKMMPIPWESYALARIKREMLHLLTRERTEFVDKTDSFDKDGYRIFNPRRATDICMEALAETATPDEYEDLIEELQRIEDRWIIANLLLANQFNELECMLITQALGILEDEIDMPKFSQSQIAAWSGLSEQWLRKIRKQALIKLHWMIDEYRSGMTTTKAFEMAMDNTGLTTEEYAALALRGGRWTEPNLSWSEIACEFAYMFDRYPIPSTNTLRRLVKRAVSKVAGHILLQIRDELEENAEKNGLTFTWTPLLSCLFAFA